MFSEAARSGKSQRCAATLHYKRGKRRRAADNYSPGIYHSARQSYTPACFPFFLSFFSVFVSALDKRGSPVPTFNKQRAPPPTGTPPPSLPCFALPGISIPPERQKRCIASRKSLFQPFKNVKNRGIRFSLVAGRMENSASLPSTLTPPYLFIYFVVFASFSCCRAQTELLLLEWGHEVRLHSADASREAALVKDPRLRVPGIAGEPERVGPALW